MKKSLTALLSSLAVCLILLIFWADSRPTETAQTEYGSQEYVPDEILVRLKEEAIGDIRENRWLIRNIVDSVQGKIITYLKQAKNTNDWEPTDFSHRSFIGDSHLFHLRVPGYIGAEGAITYLRTVPYVEYVEKNGIVRLQAQTFPDDEYFSEQWGLFNSPSRSDIHAPEAWGIHTGSSAVVVAVIDSGILGDHEDLQANIWANPNETEDSYDNDHNGFTDDLHGWDFVNGDNDPLDDSSVRHGTHVSGIIGAVGNNGLGISGVNWNVKIMSIKAFTDSGGSFADTTNGIDYATFNGAH